MNSYCEDAFSRSEPERFQSETQTMQMSHVVIWPRHQHSGDADVMARLSAPYRKHIPCATKLQIKKLLYSSISNNAESMGGGFAGVP